MPAKNRTKFYVENGYYHAYNRGVEKRDIYLDEQDYAVFLSYLRDYLVPKDEKNLRDQLSNPNISCKERDQFLRLLRLKNYSDKINLIAYTLAPNHFHFFINQKEALSMDHFIHSLSTRYSMYFNSKYKRVGALCQDVYKAVLIENEAQFIYLSKYIHKQALASKGSTLQGWQQPSSLPEYLGQRKTEWVHPEKVLNYFSKTNPNLSYKDFMEINEPEELLIIKDYIIDL